MNSFRFLSGVEDNPEKIRQMLDSILSQKQFGGLNPKKDLIQQFFESLKNNEVIRKILEAVGSVLEFIAKLILSRGEIVYVILFVLFAALLVFVIFSIRRKIAGSRIRSQEDDGHTESINPEVREKQGFAAAQQGDFVQAMRQLYISLLLCFNLKGIIEYNPSRTNRETEELLTGRSPEGFLASFGSLNRIFEDKVYALNPCDSSDFDRFREFYDTCRKEMERI